MELWSVMTLVNSNEPLSVHAFTLKDLGKRTKTLAQLPVGVLIAESIGHSFGKLLINSL